MPPSKPLPHFHALILGSGQAATPLALFLSGTLNKTVALVESNHIGGTCINEGCTPTKTMVASAKMAWNVRRLGAFGITIKGVENTEDEGKVEADMEAVRARKRKIVDDFRKGSESRLGNAKGVEIIMGKARFVGEKEVEVTLNDSDNQDITGQGVSGNKRTITADQVFINVGCNPAPLSIPVPDGIEILNSTSVMELDTLPTHLVAIGGGYVGLEFAQMFRRFGSAVTVVQRGEKLLSREDADIAGAVKNVLEDDGLTVLLNAKAEKIQRRGKGALDVSLDVAGEKTSISASHVLAAAGRVPNTCKLGLDKAGVETGRGGYIKVNERLETNIPGIFAMGDVKGGAAFTHISYDDFRIVKANILQPASASTRGRLLPYTVFIDPQLGRIGLSETEARRQRIDIQVAKMPMAWVARALEMDESRGMIKVIVDKSKGTILGAAVLGVEGGEVMSMLQVAIIGGVQWWRLRDGCFAHPGLAEGFNNLFSGLEE